MKLVLLLLALSYSIAQGQNFTRTVSLGRETYVNGVLANGGFTYTIATNSRVSIAVYYQDTLLQRTIRAADSMVAGVYTDYWDGTDDLGNDVRIPGATYKVKIVSHNLTYTWKGTVGNTSDSMSGPTKHRGYYHCMRGIAFAGQYGYFCTGYSEASPSMAKFLIATPNQKIEILDPKLSTSDINYVVSDGVKIYWGAFDANANSNTYVFATNVSTDAYNTFSSGFNYSAVSRPQVLSTIGYKNVANSYITGMAVQKIGDYLLIARAGINELLVLNKTTGAVVQTLSYTNVRGISIDSTSENNLWMITGTNNVSRYTINSNGTITAATLTLSGLVKPYTTKVSYDGTKVAVVDGATSQEVKFYNTTTGALVSTLGTTGGYYLSATVTNTKFYFDDSLSINGNKSLLPFIVFQADNSYWIGDAGNWRVMHYNSSNTYLNKVMSLGSTYSVYPDKNNINRVFSGYLEFYVDYDNIAAWTHTKNWGAKSTTAYDQFGTISYETTFPNGRTYGTIRKGSVLEIVEFTPADTLRFTGVTIPLGTVICDDGSQQYYDYTTGSAIYKRYALTGSYPSNNPQWTSTIDTLARGSTNDIFTTPFGLVNSQIFEATTGKVALFDPRSYVNYPTDVTTGWHFGVMPRKGNNSYHFKTEISNHLGYQGPYPKPRFFEVANLVNNNAGGNVNIKDRDVITSYHGEGYKNGQTNQYNHYRDDGIVYGQFGTNRDVTGEGNHAYPGMAGNSITPTLIKSGAKKYMVYGDESDHAAFGIFEIDGYSTIVEDVKYIPNPVSYTSIPKNYVDLMELVPFNSAFIDIGRWKRYPSSGGGLTTFTSRQSYDWLKDNDITMSYSNPSSAAVTDSVTCRLDTNTVATQWTISGNLAYRDNAPNDLATFQYMKVVDRAGKEIARLYPQRTGTFPLYTYHMKANSSNLFSVTETTKIFRDYIKFLRPFSITCTSTAVEFTFGDFSLSTTKFDVTSTWNQPTAIWFVFETLNNGLGVEGANVSIQNAIYKRQ